MSLTIGRSWEDNKAEWKVKAKNQGKRYKKSAVSEEVQQPVFIVALVFANQSRKNMVLQQKPLKH